MRAEHKQSVIEGVGFDGTDGFSFVTEVIDQGHLGWQGPGLVDLGRQLLVCRGIDSVQQLTPLVHIGPRVVDHLVTLVADDQGWGCSDLVVGKPVSGLGWLLGPEGCCFNIVDL